MPKWRCRDCGRPINSTLGAMDHALVSGHVDIAPVYDRKD